MDHLAGLAMELLGGMPLYFGKTFHFVKSWRMDTSIASWWCPWLRPEGYTSDLRTKRWTGKRVQLTNWGVVFPTVHLTLFTLFFGFTSGPDFNFCDSVRAAGLQVWAHFDYPCRHFNEIELIEAMGSLGTTHEQ